MSKLSRSIYFAEGDLLLQTSKTLTASVWHCCDVRHAGRCRAVDRVRRHVRDAPVVFGAHRESGVHSVCHSMTVHSVYYTPSKPQLRPIDAKQTKKRRTKAIVRCQDRSSLKNSFKYTKPRASVDHALQASEESRQRLCRKVLAN